MAERTIFLSVKPVRKEGIADSAITPGMLVARASDGKFDPHSVAGGPCMKAFAFEQELVDSADVDTAYAQNDRLYYGICSPGAEVYALVAAGAAAIADGDLLESAGDGTLRKIVGSSAALTYGTNITAATANGSLEDSAATNPSEANFNNNMKEIGEKLNGLLAVGAPIAVAKEAVNNSGGGTTARIIVEVL